MKKPTYVFLLLITIPLLGYTLYYSSTHQTIVQQPLLSLEATTTEEMASATTTEPTSKKTLTTKTGKTIDVTENDSAVADLSSFTITPTGFSTNTPLFLTVNKPASFFLFDMNKDSFDELVFLTQVDGSDEAIIYTTINDAGLLSVDIPKITENDTRKGGLFEGYNGSSTITFTSIQDTLTREFPKEKSTSTDSFRTGNYTKLFYILTINSGTPVISFSKEAPATALATTTVPSATTTPLSKTSWIWTSSVAEGTIVEAPKDIPFTLTFDETKKIQGVSDCNTFTGTYTATATKIVKFDNLASTEKLCEKTSGGIYLEMLAKVQSYTLEATTLTFILNNKETMVFSKKK